MQVYFKRRANIKEQGEITGDSRLQDVSTVEPIVRVCHFRNAIPVRAERRDVRAMPRQRGGNPWSGAFHIPGGILGRCQRGVKTEGFGRREETLVGGIGMQGARQHTKNGEAAKARN
jgi:hypothetical protein